VEIDPLQERQHVVTGVSFTGLVQYSLIRRNVLWTLDFQFGTTADGHTIKVLNLIDEFTGECPAIKVDRSITADDVVAVLDRIAAERGAPAYVWFDNGPEFVAQAVGRAVSYASIVLARTTTEIGGLT